MKQDDAPLAIAFLVTGSLGDHIAAARFVRDLLKYVTPFTFDVYSARPSVARWLFSAFPACRACYDETAWDDSRRTYPLGLWINQFVSIDHDNYDGTLVRRGNPVLSEVVEAIRSVEPQYALFVANTPRTDSLLGRRAHFMGIGRNRISHTISGLPYGGDRLDVGTTPGVRERFELDGRRYVTVHNGYELDHALLKGAPMPPAERSTRAYLGFEKVVAVLKAEFRDMMVVQIGGQSSQKIARADKHLISCTSLGETAEVLRGAILHLDSDGGLVHLATAVGTKCGVVFGPTPATYFGYKDNINIAPSVCGECWWATDDWQTNCPRGMNKPQCLSEQKPESVVDAVRPAISAAMSAGQGKRGLREMLGLR